ncbi:hypothetical protein IGI04_039588, partial [Brassica rapa subsp. trilocularis]
MYFLEDLRSPTLAGCSLALASANITAYYVVSGLTVGTETICSQAIGAKCYNLFQTTIRRGMILLVFTSLHVFLLWINIKRILTMLKHDKKLASIAHTFLLYFVPDLLIQYLLHPLRAFFKTQLKTASINLHSSGERSPLFMMFLFVSYLGFEVKGIALSGDVSNFNLVPFLFIYITFFEEKLSSDEEEVIEESYENSVREWKKLSGLAITSFGLVCLELWFYEMMILIYWCLKKPKVDVASMRIIVGNELGSNRPHGARRDATVELGFGLSILLGLMTLTFMVS